MSNKMSISSDRINQNMRIDEQYKSIGISLFRSIIGDKNIHPNTVSDKIEELHKRSGASFYRIFRTVEECSDTIYKTLSRKYFSSHYGKLAYVSKIVENHLND